MISACRPLVTAVFLSNLFLPPAASAQFIKQTDADGHVTYSQDPSYDYSKDEPSAENRRISEERLRRLEAFVEYRKRRTGAPRRKPQMTVRTGAAVCKRKISLLKAETHGCD